MYKCQHKYMVVIAHTNSKIKDMARAREFTVKLARVLNYVVRYVVKRKLY